jgi:hypothetical protein
MVQALRVKEAELAEEWAIADQMQIQIQKIKC